MNFGGFLWLIIPSLKCDWDTSKELKKRLAWELSDPKELFANPSNTFITSHYFSSILFLTVHLRIKIFLKFPCFGILLAYEDTSFSNSVNVVDVFCWAFRPHIYLLSCQPSSGTILDTLEHLKLFYESTFRQLHWDDWLCHQWESGMSKGGCSTRIRRNYLSPKNIGWFTLWSLDCR